ncbi:MAG: PspC domain-containing protein [Anaerolineales bacterium]|nr:PspC domain-containing protein [Anaerolineales bacterium]
MSNTKKLYRSREDRMIGGVCGGLGDFLGIDATIVRLLFLLVFFAGGSGLLVYIIMLIVVPEEPLGYAPTTPVSEPVEEVEIIEETSEE